MAATNITLESLLLKTKTSSTIISGDLANREIQLDQVTGQITFKDNAGALFRLNPIDDASELTTRTLSASKITSDLSGKAPTSHAVDASTYGYGSAAVAGHLKVGTGLSVTDGTISLPNVGSAGTYTKVTTDAQGRISSATTLGASDLPAHTHADAGNGGTIDHGAITGLTDDDHTIYILADGTRAFSGVVSGVTPTDPAHLTTKGYVDGVAQGLSWKDSCVCATTANGTLASDFEAGDTIDGYTLVEGDRILIKNQTSGAENGIYVVAASGAPTRATDGDSAAELINACMFIEQGTTNADTAWVCTNNSITLETTEIVFVQFGAGAAYSAGDGIDITGTTVSADFGTTATTVCVGNDSRLLTSEQLSGLTGAGDTSLHNHDSMYYTQTQLGTIALDGGTYS